MIYAYMRVSTGNQNLENQKFEILKYANAQQILIEQWVEETISGNVKSTDRDLGNLIKSLKKDDIVIVTELSRLGRSLLDVMGLLNELMNRNVKLISIKEGYSLGDNISSKVLAFAFGLSSEIERQLISQRTKEALNRKKAEGFKLGRPIGTKSVNPKLVQFEKEILELESYKVSYRAISRIYKVHHSTIKRFIMNRKGP